MVPLRNLSLSEPFKECSYSLNVMSFAFPKADVIPFTAQSRKQPGFGVSMPQSFPKVAKFKIRRSHRGGIAWQIGENSFFPLHLRLPLTSDGPLNLEEPSTPMFLFHSAATVPQPRRRALFHKKKTECPLETECPGECFNALSNFR